METLMRKAANEVKRCYFGRVIDNFTCDDPIMHKSLPHLMGEHLFYHIVDSPQTATRIIADLDAADLPGEVNFYALSIIDSCEFNDSETVSCLSFDVKFRKVFAKICAESSTNRKDLDNQSSDTASSATLDSGFIEENGALIGVELSFDIDSMELYQQQQDLVDLEEATRYELSENSYRMDSTIVQINETGEMLGQQHQTMSKIQQVQSMVAKITQAINVCEARIQTKQTELQKYEAKVQGLVESKTRYENEMNAELLTEQELKSIELVQTAIVAEKVKLQQVIAEMKELQKKRDTISDYHENSLMSRYSVLEEQSMTHSNNLAELNRQTEILEHSEEVKRQASERIIEIQHQLTALGNEHEKKRQTLKELEQQKLALERTQTYLFAALNSMNLQQKSLTTEMSRLREQKPYDATEIHNPDIVGMSESDIDNQLSIAQHQLRTFENSNSFDLNMLDSFKKERDNFVRRRKELSNMEFKITLAMEKMEANIKTSIRSTFDDLANRFAANFANFVPGGTGRLHLIEEETIENEENASAMFENQIKEAVGLNIFAQFDQTELPFDHLFGQKRRVVALVFIISMQQLCPVPFYLIDCIQEVIKCNCHINI